MRAAGTAADAGDGLAVGLMWTSMIANDLGQFLFMGRASGPSVYFVQAAPLCAFIPLITVTLFSGLMRSQPSAN